MIGDLGMKVSAEALELGEEQDRVGVIDLGRRISSAAPLAPDSDMRGGDLIKFRASFVEPALQ